MASPVFSLPVTGTDPKITTKQLLESNVNAVVASLYREISTAATGLNPRGSWDASGGSFPSGTEKGDYYIVSVAGTVDSQAFIIGDWLVSLADGASTTTFAANWFRGDYSQVLPKSYASIAALSLLDSALDQGYYVINPTGETFQYDEDSTTTADGTLIVDATGMGAGRFISTRTAYNDFAEFSGDGRTLVDGTRVSIGRLNYLADSGAPSGLGIDGFIPIGHVFMAHYNLTGTGDEGPQMQSAVDRAAAQGVTLTQEISIQTAQEIQFPDGLTFDQINSAVIDPTLISTAQPNDCVVYINGGSIVDLPALASDLVADETIDFVFASAHGLSLGDVFSVWNPTNGSYHADENYWRQGQAFKVMEVATSTTLQVDLAPVFDVTAVNFECHKWAGGRVNTPNGLRVVGAPAQEGLEGINSEILIGQNTTGWQVDILKGKAGLRFGNCFDCSGLSMLGFNGGDAAGGFDYGVLIANCQHLDFSGRFSANRHGATTGGGSGDASIVNRFVRIGGHISSQNRDITTVLAADWHANAEYCTYWGIIDGGVSLGGDHNRVERGTIVTANYAGFLCYSGPLTGCDHSLAGVTFRSDKDLTISNRGSIDIGGNGNAIDANTPRGGLIDFSDTTWYVQSQVTSQIIRAYNRGPTAGCGMTLRGATFYVHPSTSTELLQLSKTSTNPNWYLDLRDIEIIGEPVSWGDIDVDTIRLWDQRETGSLSVTSGGSFADVVHTFTQAYPTTPLALVQNYTWRTSGDGRPVYAVNASSSSSVTLRVTEADGTTFNSTETLEYAIWAG